jgi:hypothetical protein
MNKKYSRVNLRPMRGLPDKSISCTARIKRIEKTHGKNAQTPHIL